MNGSKCSRATAIGAAVMSPTAGSIILTTMILQVEMSKNEIENRKPYFASKDIDNPRTVLSPSRMR